MAGSVEAGSDGRGVVMRGSLQGVVLCRRSRAPDARTRRYENHY
jgi:hypothetical protein